MDKVYGIVLVGCGYIGAKHMDSLYYRDEVRVIGVVDKNESAARLYARKYGALSWSTDYRDYLTRDDADIFLIASNVSSHVPILEDCIRFRKHALCEKPVAGSLEETLHIIDNIRRSESKVLFGHILRHSKTYQQAVELIANGEIGDLRVLRMVHSHHALDWARCRALLDDCSPIVDCGVHYFDIAQWFTGSKIVQVGGISSVLDSGLPEDRYNYGLITMQLQNGSVAYFEAGWSPNNSCENVKQFIGNKGYIHITMGADRPYLHEEGDLIRLYQSESEKYSDINLHSCTTKNMVGQFHSLIDMIENNSEGNPSLDSVESVMKVAFAADRALREKRTISLDPVTQQMLD